MAICGFSQRISQRRPVVIEDHVIEGMVGIQHQAHAPSSPPRSLVRVLSEHIIQREPLSYINGIDCAVVGFDIDRIQNIEENYRTLYVHWANMTASGRWLPEPEFDFQTDTDTVLSFIRQSDSGIFHPRLF